MLQAKTAEERFIQHYLTRLNRPQYRNMSVSKVTEVSGAIRRAEAHL